DIDTDFFEYNKNDNHPKHNKCSLPYQSGDGFQPFFRFRRWFIREFTLPEQTMFKPLQHFFQNSHGQPGQKQNNQYADACEQNFPSNFLDLLP
ncbi:MAG: hypothetical protein LC657_11370, partial [Desulfobacteraceae bacterium]|nr:hypothetical protein [Desulfobacteraceae bacterium]